MDTTVPAAVDPSAHRRPPADRFVRRVLGLAEDAPRVSIIDAQNAFGKSLVLSGLRCLLTYVLIPIAGPILGLTGVLGPILGFALSAVSMVAIVFAVRRFFAADYKWRWGYLVIGGGVFILLTVQVVLDIVHLLT